MKKKNRPYKYNSKSRLTPNSQSFPFKVKSIKDDVVENLENTLTKLRIIDDNSTKIEKLDNSFLEGRSEKKEDKKKKDNNKNINNNNHKKKEKKIEKEKERKKEINNEKLLSSISFLRKFFLSVSAVCAVILIVLYGYNLIRTRFSNWYDSARDRIVILDNKSSTNLDDNYLFVGDFHTQNFSFEKYHLDYHYVKVGSNTLTTNELLNHMKDMIYDYNPSVVFIEIGFMDLNNGLAKDEIIRNYGRIIDLIQTNRPNAIIFIESVYPVGNTVKSDIMKRSVSNRDINDLNNGLKVLAKTKKVRYMDVYSTLQKGNKLNGSYTNDGIHLNDSGYKAYLDEVNNIIG